MADKQEKISKSTYNGLSKKVIDEKDDILDETKDEVKVEEDKKEELLYNSFDDMEFLNLDLLKGIFEYGFEYPSKIQNLTIKHIYEGKDIIAQSQSGTGKTGAFSIGTLSRINPEVEKTQAIIIANTKELATQIHSVVRELSKHMKINVELCIGGLAPDVRANNQNTVKKAHVIIGTPGRLNDLIKRKSFNIKDVNILVMDEADALLKNDFSEQIKTIVVRLRTDTQICIFSATYPTKVLELALEFMNNPVRILLKKEELSLDLIKQYKVYVEQERYKYATLTDIYNNIYIGQCMIFVNSIDKCENLGKQLADEGHNVGMIHGAMSVQDRSDVLKDFRTNKLRVLLSTDVLSRGIDVQQIGLVINYDVPSDKAQYLHRIGRSGRYGKVGVAVNFTTKRDSYLVSDLERSYNIKISDMPSFDVVNKQLSGLTTEQLAK